MTRFRLACAAAILLAAALPVPAQTVLFQEDFDDGIPADWINLQLNYVGDIWKPGFGLIDGTGDVYHEGWCDFGVFFRDNVLISPPIDLGGATDLTLTLDQYHNAAASLFYNAIEVTLDDGETFQVAHQITNPPNGPSSLTVDMSPFARHQTIRIALHYQGVISNDWSVDNLLLTTPWADLGNSLGGLGFDPTLVGSGPLTPGSDVTLLLTDGVQGVLTYLVVGLSTIHQPFKGGVMVPKPDAVFPFITSDGDGGLELNGTWPPGLPSGTTVVFQHWLLDGAGPFGFLASNAVAGTTP